MTHVGWGERVRNVDEFALPAAPSATRAADVALRHNESSPPFSPSRQVVSQALLSATDRDAMSGWGAVVHVLTPEGITTRRLKARMD